MTTLYILQNQHGYYLKKNSSGTDKEWVDGREPNTLFRTTHKDEAVNMLFETNSQNVELRISTKEYEANAKNQPLIPTEDLPPPLEIEPANANDEDNTLSLLLEESTSPSTATI